MPLRHDVEVASVTVVPSALTGRRPVLSHFGRSILEIRDESARYCVQALLQSRSCCARIGCRPIAHTSVFLTNR